uniref:ATP synthase F0 subunit 8 n=1 Tax=Acrasis kona TaxID=1008807 RepID=A0A0B4MZE0_9EUKA|nr:ATP synthase F0 subunit 8 [Acrasis kona]AID52032.1 ATP synthase F0 subunit 8 [Acrasis kona]
MPQFNIFLICFIISIIFMFKESYYFLSKKIITKIIFNLKIKFNLSNIIWHTVSTLISILLNINNKLNFLYISFVKILKFNFLMFNIVYDYIITNIYTDEMNNFSVDINNSTKGAIKKVSKINKNNV